jgi:hypothetical protein
VPHLPQKECLTHHMFTAMMAAAIMACRTGASATAAYDCVAQVFSEFKNAFPLGGFRLGFESPMWASWSKQEEAAGRKGKDELSDDEALAAHRAPPPPPPPLLVVI